METSREKTAELVVPEIPLPGKSKELVGGSGLYPASDLETAGCAGHAARKGISTSGLDGDLPASPYGPSAVVLEAFERNLAELTRSGHSLLGQLERTYSSEWVINAIREAEDTYPRGEMRHPLAYVRRILVRYKSEQLSEPVDEPLVGGGEAGRKEVVSQLADAVAANAAG